MLLVVRTVQKSISGSSSSAAGVHTGSVYGGPALMRLHLCSPATTDAAETPGKINMLQQSTCDS
jgi:hypothetical protein